MSAPKEVTDMYRQLADIRRAARGVKESSRNLTAYKPPKKSDRESIRPLLENENEEVVATFFLAPIKIAR